jgi:hypothetical protein
VKAWRVTEKEERSTPPRNEVIAMKKFYSLAAAMAFLLGCGMAYAEENSTLPKDSSDKIDTMTPDSNKMIRDDDIQRLRLDQDRGTIDQMPESSGGPGSGAGGVTNDRDRWKNNEAPSLPAVDPPVNEPAPDESISGGDRKKHPDMGDYHYGY